MAHGANQQKLTTTHTMHDHQHNQHKLTPTPPSRLPILTVTGACQYMLATIPSIYPSIPGPARLQQQVTMQQPISLPVVHKTCVHALRGLPGTLQLSTKCCRTSTWCGDLFQKPA